MRRHIPFLLAALLVALLVGVAPASAAGSRTWVNDFEHRGDDTPAGGWYADPPTTITRTPSGASATYASGIQSANGNWHARLSPNSPCPKVQASFACQGPYTYWGKPNGFNPVFPDGGYVTEIAVYLDVQWMTQDPVNRTDTRFDWISSINDRTGSFRRDFVFNAGTPLNPAETAAMPGYYVNASTNAFRSGAFPENPCPSPSTPPNYCRSPVKIDQSGWYRLRHYFHLVTIGGNVYLAVDMTIVDKNNAVVPGASWTIYDQQDASGFGGDRYGWFAINEIQDLAADCSAIHPPGKKHPTLCKFAHHGGDAQCDRNAASDQAEQDELARINRERSAALLPPLTLNTTSSDAARQHSCYERNHGNDDQPDSPDPARVDAPVLPGNPLALTAENFGFSDNPDPVAALAEVQSDLIADPVSLANELNPAFTQVGIGVVYRDGVMWLTEDFSN